MQCNKTRFSALVRQLEERGCVIEHGLEGLDAQGQGLAVLALVPGLDQWCPLPMGSSGNALQKLFWNQVELRLDEKSGKVSARWNYASRGCLWIHGAVTLMVMLGLYGRASWIDGILILTAANAVPFLMAYLETWAILRQVEKENGRKTL